MYIRTLMYQNCKAPCTASALLCTGSTGSFIGWICAAEELGFTMNEDVSARSLYLPACLPVSVSTDPCGAGCNQDDKKGSAGNRHPVPVQVRDLP